MKLTKLGLVAAVLFCGLCLPKMTLARGSFHIGLGYNYSNFHHPHHWHHGRWPGRHYGWIDRGYYRWLDHGRYRGPWGHHYRRRPHCGGGIGIWLGDCWPIVVERPTVITRKTIVVKRPNNDYAPKYDAKTLKLFKDLRGKKRELLKRLQIGDKQQRKQAVSELAGFSFDEKVRKALEEVLLSDPEPELREEAAKSFGKVKNRGALVILKKVRVEDSALEVREEADKAIKLIEGS
ncbi:MAG: HEAT repeat domain-containing protein [Planctomycetota bacterium]